MGLVHNIVWLIFQVYIAAVQQGERELLIDKETKAARTTCSSNYSWARLSPDSQAKRRSNIVKERRMYAEKAEKLQSNALLSSKF